MDCPVCKRQLTQVMVGDVEVDVCQGGCGGVWFDEFELKKLDEPHEHMGEALSGISYDPSIPVKHDEKRHCPKCKDIIMRRHFFSAKREVEVDNCGKCGGYWLDLGEIHKIRSQFESEEERKAFAQEMFDDLFSADLAQMKQESEEDLRAAKKVSHILRFICPSYYIPGKQKWGGH